MKIIKVTLQNGESFTYRVDSRHRGATLLRFDVGDMYAEDVAAFRGIDIYADTDDNYVVYNGKKMLNDDFNDMVVRLEVV